MRDQRPATPGAFPRLTRSADELRRVVPAELIELPRWLSWHTSDGTIVVVSPRSGSITRPSDASAWASFTQALDFHGPKPSSTGIGLVIAPSDPLLPIRLPFCIEATGDLAGWARAILALFPDGYAERFGHGLTLWIAQPDNDRALVPAAAVKIEDHARFVPLTGDSWPPPGDLP